MAVAGLAVVVAALAREVGLLRLRLGPAAALELEGEGPDLNRRVAAIERFDLGPGTELALAVFTSDGCHVCHGLRPSIESMANDPLLAVETFDEVADAGVWRELSIPGSPYAIALDPDGTRARQGDLQQPRPARERAGDGRTQAGGGERCLSGPGAGSSGPSSRSRRTARGVASWPGSERRSRR